MSLQQFFKRYSIILVLSFIAIGMGVIKWTYEGQQTEKLVPPTETQPTAVPTEKEESIEEKAQKFNESYPLFNKLPYKGKSFAIEQYEEPLTLNITIDKGADKAKVLKEVDAWLSKNKIATDSHKLVIQ